MERWFTAFFATLGGFFFCGLGGSLIADLSGFWHLPVAGFFAAFGTVTLAYFSVPNYKDKIAYGILLVGSMLAWLLLEPSNYPSSYEDKAYQPTHIPFLVTVIGGIVALVLCVFPASKRAKNA
ncbi:hypothetical protein [Litoribrevibacter albus]|uniref:Uncharacterized protein n=1 Tax=Litoribrevibacter albus TaxID=1473156 RepID=A0AA37S9P8_9GAMM|nr:hypothetical protein [Litoribrevibacter albus]GLQ30909.1 hypothetical protein GCM10007876_13880 [Litoribrevibacter albus]